jgi:hypothetical protein
VRDYRLRNEVRERRTQTADQPVYAGSRLKLVVCGKVPPYMPAFQPYRGKPAVRNDREDRGNVGIIRSPVRASILPDCGGRAMKRTSLPLLRRREFITLLGGAAAGWPLAAHAQQPAAGDRVSACAIHQRCHAAGDGVSTWFEGTGYVEGQSVTIEYRWARGRYDSLEVRTSLNNSQRDTSHSHSGNDHWRRSRQWASHRYETLLCEIR